MKNMRSILVGSIVVVALLAAGFVTSVLAQGGPPPDGMRGPHPPAVIMKAGTTGLFVLAGPNLVKYDPKTLAQTGVYTLPAPTASGDSNNQHPPMPPHIVMLVATIDGLGENVLLIAGDQFLRIDGATLQVKAKGTLPKVEMPAPPQGGQGGPDGMRPPMGAMGAPPMPELKGSMLYIQRMDQIFAINVTDGSITGAATLPKPQPPAQ